MVLIKISQPNWSHFKYLFTLDIEHSTIAWSIGFARPFQYYWTYIISNRIKFKIQIAIAKTYLGLK